MVLGLKDNFEFEGYEVLTAADGATGLERARSQKPDLVVLDIMLPKLSGLEVCKMLRGEGFGKPIIMLTARGQEIDKVVGLELGADDYVTKPFSIREPLDMSPREFELLRYLIERKGETVSRDRLLEDVWGYESYPSTRTVDTHIAKLRAKIGDSGSEPRYILTIHGVGYKFVDPDNRGE